MKRESLNISLTESLRQAQIRQRLDGMAAHTGVTASQIAGRALTLGLSLIESDLRRLFPGQADGYTAPVIASPSIAPTDAAQQSEASQSSESPTLETPSTAEGSVAPSRNAMHSTDMQRAAKDSTAPLEPAPADIPSRRFISTADAALSLGYRDESAFRQHTRRHPELKRLSKKRGRNLLWDLPKLRTEYQLRQWQPR